MRKILLNILILLFVGEILGSSQVTHLKTLDVDLFTIDNGLAQSTVTCIMQDSKGFLWIGTQDGLTRFDGYEFQNFKNDPLNTNSIAYNYINAITEDKKGDLWVATGAGLSKLIRKSGKFINYFNDLKDQGSVSDNRILSVYADTKGEIWVHTSNSIDKFDPEKQSFVHYNTLKAGVNFSVDISSYPIFEDSRGVLWVGTNEGLYYLNEKINSFEPFSFSNNDLFSLTPFRIKDIIEDSKGLLWLATDKGIFTLNSEKRILARFNGFGATPNISLSDNVNSLFQDKSGMIWIGTDLGLFSYEPSKNILKNYKYLNSKGKTLPTLLITSILEDNSQNLWVGTFQGLVKYDTKGTKFNLYSKSVDGDNLFSNNDVSSVFKDKTGLIWVGTWGSGLYIYNPNSTQTIRYSTSTSKKICNDNVHVIKETQDGQLLIGTRNGIQTYLPDSKEFIDFFNFRKIDAKDLFFQNRIYSITEDSNRNLWIATIKGLFKVTRNDIVKFYHNPLDTTTISSNECYDVIVDNEGLVWLGTFNGLNCLDPTTGKVSRYFKSQGFKGDGLISNEITCLYQDSKGFIWVGTSTGLHKFDKIRKEFKVYTEHNGLPNNLIYSIEEDNNGVIWLSTNWGIAALNPSSEQVSVYDLADGLQSHEFNINASYKAFDGEIFFGGINGVNSFYPDSIRVNKNIPQIAITNFEIISKKGVETIPVIDGDEVVLPSNFSTITIQFAALDFTRPDRNVYSYRMVGLNDNWVEIGSKREITFSKLNGGKYLLQLKGSNNDKIWNDEGISVSIIVPTIFYKTRFAFAIYFVLFVFGLVVFVRVVNKKYRATRELLRERELVLVEMQEHREELLLKNKNITDSINYAKRIQEAIMPSTEYFKKLLPDTFILYMPKDIVSGDFYWVNETKNKIFVAVLDCTGHGVPGAFMSIIGVELLRNITNIQGIDDAAEILNRLNTGINETFKKGIMDESVKVKDGMDVAFCVIDKENNLLQYAGAFSDMYLIRDSKVTEIKGDRSSVGMGNDSNRQFFSSHYVPIHPDDMIYIFTDGYVDQFGGPDGKKYKFRRFRHLLLNIHKFPMEIQRQYLEESFKEWKGDHEQVDDVLIIGIKPDLSCIF